MSQPRRPVQRSEYFVQVAQSYFPPGGSAAGDPSFELFERGPLGAVEDLCAIAFESMFEIEPGIRVWTTIEAPLFPPMTFFAVLDTTGCVELVDLLVDAGYEWDPDADEPF